MEPYYITPDIAQIMSEQAYFSINDVFVPFADRRHNALITFGWYHQDLGEILMAPISGFPRPLVRDAPKRGNANSIVVVSFILISAHFLQKRLLAAMGFLHCGGQDLPHSLYELHGLHEAFSLRMSNFRSPHTSSFHALHQASFRSLHSRHNTHTFHDGRSDDARNIAGQMSTTTPSRPAPGQNTS